MLAVFSAGKAQAEEAIDARIEKAEQLLLGKTASDQSFESRLDAVEMSLYGKTKHGSVLKRVDAISDFLGLKDGGSSKATSASAAKADAVTKTDAKPQAADTASNASEPAKTDTVKTDTANADAPKTEAASADTKDDVAKAFSTTAKEDAERAASQAAAQAAAQEERENTDLSRRNASKTTGANSVVRKTDASKTNASKTIVPNTAVSATSKVGLIPLKPQEAKMAMPPTAPKKIDSMPPAAPSIAATMNSTGPNAQARDLLREGLRQYSSGQYREAEDTFRRVLTVDPRNADAFYNLGSLAERNHDFVMALTNYRAALNFNPKDKDYIAAVTAMEHQLSASSRSSAASTSAQRTATLGHFKVPVDVDTSSAPLNAGYPVSTGQPFQLSGTQNDVLMNTTQFTNNNYMPTMNVNQQPPPPTMGVAQQPPKKGGGFGKVMNVGMRAAFYSSGLHCPVCRIMGGGFHF